MSKATMRELYKFLAKICHVRPRRLELYGRVLREAGHIETGRPGRGGSPPDATPQSAAALLIAVLAGDSAAKAADAVSEIGSLNGEELNLAGMLVPAGTFIDALACMIEKMGDRSVQNIFLEQVRDVAVNSKKGEPGAWFTVKLTKNADRRHHFGGYSRHSPTGLARTGSLDVGTLVEIADLLRGQESGPTSGSGSPETEA